MGTRKPKTRLECEDPLRNGRKSIDARLVTDRILGIKLGDVIQYPGAQG
jgi:hypothetical protein